MALFFDFTCPNCGFEIQTADSYHYCLFSGTYFTCKCVSCGTIQAMKMSMKCYKEGDVGFSKCLEGLSCQCFNSVCPECGEKGNYVSWEPKKGCPKCGEQLKKSIGSIMMD